MSSLLWFSAKVRLVALTERQGGLHYADSVFVFRAKDYRNAFERALELGRAQEESYENEEGDKVYWRLKEVLTLDQVKARSLDGAEVLYESHDVPEHERITSRTRLNPEESKPRETF